MLLLVGHHLSMTKLSTDYLRWNVIRCLMSVEPSLKRQKARKVLPSCKALASVAIPAEIYKTEALQLQRNWQSYFTLYEEKKPSLKNYWPIQTERESSGLWQSSGHLFIVDCWEDPCKSPTELTEWTPWSVRASCSKPMLMQEGQRNNWHNLTARQLLEKCQEQNVDLYMTFGDLTKAFDTVSREELWKLRQSLAVLPNL